MQTIDPIRCKNRHRHDQCRKCGRALAGRMDGITPTWHARSRDGWPALVWCGDWVAAHAPTVTGNPRKWVVKVVSGVTARVRSACGLGGAQ